MYRIDNSQKIFNYWYFYDDRTENSSWPLKKKINRYTSWSLKICLKPRLARFGNEKFEFLLFVQYDCMLHLTKTRKIEGH